MEDIYRSYYTRSDPIVRYMIKILSTDSGMTVLEPCAGDGIFVDALLSEQPNLAIDAYELNPQAFALLKSKYRSCNNIRITYEDVLTSQELELYANAGGIYDRIIANPPYGGWQSQEKRALLKKLYPGLYVKETYTLFLFRCIQLLKDSGILVFIVPDTFLNLHMHTKLRDYLLTHTKICEIALFPSSFFPGAGFGYANLAIIALQKAAARSDCLGNPFQVLTGFQSVTDLGGISKGCATTLQFSQRQIYENLDHALLVTENLSVVHLINRPEAKIGDIAACVTGFYSGDDKRYLRAAPDITRNGARYQTIAKEAICDNFAERSHLLEGIRGTKCFIPIVKGGGIRYFKPDTWYMDWSVAAVADYKTNKKARLQNADFYFNFGIAVPMVSSSQVTAALLEHRLFDQSIVGIFPKDPQWIYYLLAFFNSPTCNRLIRTINPSANNSANYIKKIPFIYPSEVILEEIDTLVKAIISDLKTHQGYDVASEQRLHHLIEQTYRFALQQQGEERYAGISLAAERQ